MKHTLLFLILTSCTLVSQEYEYDTLCISLGWNCQVGANLRDNGLRHLSFPFDWNQTPYSGLCTLIRNRFKDLLNPNHLIYKAPHAAGVFNTTYNVALSHAFPTYIRDDGVRMVVENYRDFLTDADTIYQRRIARFYEACSMARFVYFFRIGSDGWRYDTYVGKHNVTELRDVLLEAFPQKNWLLVILHDNEEYQEDWCIPMVTNIHMPTITGNTHPEWKVVLQKIGLVEPGAHLNQ